MSRVATVTLSVSDDARRVWTVLLAALTAALILVVGAGGAAAQSGRPDSFADLAERMLPSVVNISTTQSVSTSPVEEFEFPPGSPLQEFFRDYFEGRRPPGGETRRAASLGSGFIIDTDDGYVVTNNHVLGTACEQQENGEDAEIAVILQDDTRIEAECVGQDRETDLALLKVDASQLRGVVETTWGDSDEMRVGDWVMAIGNPFGLGGTVTAGIISARARDINVGRYDDFLQTDASINRGNSGGPMFNLDGEVIGVNTAIFSPSGGSIGIGFAIPSNLARPVIAQLREFGRTRRGWLGVRIQQVTEEMTEELALDAPRGALVAGVNATGPAEAAGIEPGDVIIRFNNQEVEEMRRLPRIVADTRVGATVPVVIWRDGREVEVEVELGELEAAEEAGLLETATGPSGEEDQSEAVSSLGLQLAPVTRALREEFDLDRTEGVVVTDVASNSPASEKGISAGDVILEVNQDEVETPEDVVAAVNAAKEAGKRSVLLLIDRSGDSRFVALTFEE